MPAGAVARAPGVSVEWVSADVPVPAAVRTDVAGFIGLAQRGPVHQPVRLASWTQFQAVFGGYDPRGWLAYAVNGFFANGGNVAGSSGSSIRTRPRPPARRLSRDPALLR